MESGIEINICVNAVVSSVVLLMERECGLIEAYLKNLKQNEH